MSGSDTRIEASMRCVLREYLGKVPPNATQTLDKSYRHPDQALPENLFIGPLGDQIAAFFQGIF